MPVACWPPANCCGVVESGKLPLHEPVPPPLTEEDAQITWIAEAGIVPQLVSVLLLAATVMFQVLVLSPPVICQDKATGTVPDASGAVGEKETVPGSAVIVPTEACSKLAKIGTTRMRVTSFKLLWRNITMH